MTTEQKLEQAGEKYKNYIQCSTKVSFEEAIFTDLDDAFIAGAKSEASKEYWIEKLQTKVNLDEEIKVQYELTGSLSSENIIKRGFSLGLSASKEYWQKQFEKEKLEFAIEQLKYVGIYTTSGKYTLPKIETKVKELEQKLSELAKTKDHEI